MKLRLKQIGIFLSLLLLVDVVMQLAGMRAGTIDNNIYPLDTLIYEPRYQADSLGISSFFQSGVIAEHVVNKQGFISAFDFDRTVIDSLRQHKDQPVVMMVGDSYTEGCCAWPSDQSFGDFLERDDEYILLNFGIGATGIFQYQLILEKYVSELQPDLVVIPFYFGNDIASFPRPVTPYVPICYTIKDYAWLNSVGPHYLMADYPKAYFESPEEAYQFYLNSFTLWGDTVTSFQKIIRHSAIASKLYLAQREKQRLKKWDDFYYTEDKDSAVTLPVLHRMNEICQAANVPLIFLGTPSPKDAINQVDLEQKYGRYFLESKCYYPEISQFSEEDYDGTETANHFNNAGHLKFYEFVRPVIRKSLEGH